VNEGDEGKKTLRGLPSGESPRSGGKTSIAQSQRAVSFSTSGTIGMTNSEREVKEVVIDRVCVEGDGKEVREPKQSVTVDGGLGCC
jgi:hypothetical protein